MSRSNLKTQQPPAKSDLKSLLLSLKCMEAQRDSFFGRKGQQKKKRRRFLQKGRGFFFWNKGRT